MKQVTQSACSTQQRATTQKGFALVIALIFILVLTILGLTAMQTSTLQERMAGSGRDRNTAFQATETALRAAESALTGIAATSFTDTCSNGLCTTGNAPDYATYNWATGTAHVDVSTLPSPWNTAFNTSLADNPKYYVEHAGQMKSPGKKGGWVDTYRVTARGMGVNASTRVFLQETYRP